MFCFVARLNLTSTLKLTWLIFFKALSSALAASETPKDKLKAPNTETLATLLEQALQSSDDTLLDQCLATADSKVVEATVDRLSTMRVLPLLLG